MALGTIAGEDTAVDDQGTAADRIVVMNADNDVPIPAGLRGTSQNLTFQMLRSNGTPTVTWDVYCSVKMDVVFHSKPEHDAT